MMRRIGTTGAAIGFAATVGMAGAANAAGSPESQLDPVQTTGSITVVDRGGDNSSGWVEYTGTGTITINDTTPTARGGWGHYGGGVWSYGSRFSGAAKTCYSHYTHPTSKPVARVAMGDLGRKVVAPAGSTARAEVLGTILTGTCKAYWGKA